MVSGIIEHRMTFRNKIVWRTGGGTRDGEANEALFKSKKTFGRFRGLRRRKQQGWASGSLVTKVINPECYKEQQRWFLGHLSTSRA